MGGLCPAAKLTDAQIKHTIAQEERAQALFTHDESIYSPRCARQWESFTQGGGALIRPESVHVTFNSIADVPFSCEDEGPVQAAWTGKYGETGQRGVFDRGVQGTDFGEAILRAGEEARMWSVGPYKAGV